MKRQARIILAGMITLLCTAIQAHGWEMETSVGSGIAVGYEGFHIAEAEEAALTQIARRDCRLICASESSAILRVTIGRPAEEPKPKDEDVPAPAGMLLLTICIIGCESVRNLRSR